MIILKAQRLLAIKLNSFRLEAKKSSSASDAWLARSWAHVSSKTVLNYPT